MKLIILTLLIFISSCNQKVKQKEGEEVEIEEEVENISEPDFTIFEFDSSWYWIFKNVETTDISKSELNEIDQLIDLAIRENNENQKKYLQKHNLEYPEHQWTETGFELDLEKGYHKQYVPVINESGEKIVWINFFCSTFNYNWKKEIIMVDDGGNCFFNIKINLTKKTYSELSINGYA